MVTSYYSEVWTANLVYSELYNPTMVTIVVSESGVVEPGRKVAPAEEFTLPRALICSHSRYFESAFQRQWTESKSRRLEIDDLSPQIFRVFVAWLFYQEIFYDGERVEPETTACEEQQTDQHVSQGSVRQSRAESTADSKSKGKANTSKHDIARRKKRHSFVAEADSHDPVTWAWTDLFELYVFAEKASHDPREQSIEGSPDTSGSQDCCRDSCL